MTRSRVVPGWAVTMARSRSTSPIEEARFAHIWTTHDGQGQALVNDFAVGKGGG